MPYVNAPIGCTEMVLLGLHIDIDPKSCFAKQDTSADYVFGRIGVKCGPVAVQSRW